MDNNNDSLHLEIYLSEKILKEGGKRLAVNSESPFLGPNLWDKNYMSDFNMKLENINLDEILNDSDLQDNILKSAQAIPVDDTNSMASLSVQNSDATVFDLNKLADSIASETRQHSPQEIVSPQSIPVAVTIGTSLPSANSNKRSTRRNPQPYSTRTRNRRTTRTLRESYSEDSNSTTDDSPFSTLDHSRSPTSVVTVQATYGPRKFNAKDRHFSEDDLKSSPVLKKSKKQHVPADKKDDHYWARRMKNNVAAKRSRDERRKKETEVAMLVDVLQKENGCLKEKIQLVKQQNELLKAQLAIQEGTPGYS